MRIQLKDGRQMEITVRKQGDLYEYYWKEQKIGVWDPNTSFDQILILQNTLDNELKSQIKDSINQIDRKEIEKDSKETKEIDTYMREIGDRNLKVREIRKIELPKKEEKEEKKDKNAKEKKQGKKEEEKATIKDVDVKQTIDLNERANDMHDVKKWLNAKLPEGISKIGIIESDRTDQMKDENGKSYERASTRYSLVTINQKGEVEPLAKYLPQLKQRNESGNNPREEKYQVRDDGKVEKNAVLSEYELGDKILQIDNKEMGRVELNIGEEARNSTETMGMQVRDENTLWAERRQVRESMGEYEKEGEDTVEQNLKEAKSHDVEKCKMDERDVDGDPNTKSHTHNYDNVIMLSDGKQITYSELATRWGLVNDGKPDAEHAKEKFLEKQKQDLERKPEEIIEELDEEYEDPRIQGQRK